MRAVRILLMPILLFACFQALPEFASAVVCNGKTAIVYGNGMFNDKKEAKDSMNELEIRLFSFPQSLLYRAELEFHLAYADNGGATSPASLAGLAQLYEAFAQKQAANDSFFWRWLGSIAIAPAWFKTVMNDLAANTNANAYVNDATLQQQLDGDASHPTLQPGYRALLKQGDRIVIVAHSQGNFYANVAYDALVSQSPDFVHRLGIVAVASPDSRVAGGGQHITVPEDTVIAAIRFVYPLTLDSSPASGSSPNMAELGQATYDSATYGHSFVQWYLAGSYTRDYILNATVQTIGKLETPFANSPTTTFASSQYSIHYPYTFADASRCIRDDANRLGFYTDILHGYVTIAVSPLSETNTYVPAYTDYIPAPQSGWGGREAIGILPVPSGVGIVYADRSEKGAYVFNNQNDDFAIFGDTTVYLISYTWDQTTGNWSKQTSQLALPPHTMSVINRVLPATGGAGSSGPALDPGAIPAYYSPVVYQDALYHFGGELDSPGYQSKMVFGGYVNWQVQGSWLMVSLDNGQLSAGASGVFSLPWDASHINLVSSPLVVGVPGNIPLQFYDGLYLQDFGFDSTITTK